MVNALVAFENFFVDRFCMGHSIHLIHFSEFEHNFLLARQSGKLEGQVHLLLFSQFSLLLLLCLLRFLLLLFWGLSLPDKITRSVGIWRHRRSPKNTSVKFTRSKGIECVVRMEDCALILNLLDLLECMEDLGECEW